MKTASSPNSQPKRFFMSGYLPRNRKKGALLPAQLDCFGNMVKPKGSPSSRNLGTLKRPSNMPAKVLGRWLITF